MDLGEKIKSLRMEKDATLHEVSMGTDIDMTLLSKIERGERLPTKEQVKKIAKYYNFDFEKLTIELTAAKIINEYGINDITYQAANLVKETISTYNRRKINA